MEDKTKEELLFMVEQLEVLVKQLCPFNDTYADLIIAHIRNGAKAQSRMRKSDED